MDGVVSVARLARLTALRLAGADTLLAAESAEPPTSRSETPRLALVRAAKREYGWWFAPRPRHVTAEHRPTLPTARSAELLLGVRWATAGGGQASSEARRVGVEERRHDGGAELCGRGEELVDAVEVAERERRLNGLDDSLELPSPRESA